MANRMAVLLGAVTVALAAAGCDEAGSPVAPTASQLASTVSSGSESTLLGRASFGDPGEETFKVKRITGDWHVEVKANPNLDLAVQRIVFQPGGQSGWHTHPGPVFIQVVSGTMTFYESDDPECEPIVAAPARGIWMWVSMRTSPATRPVRSPRTWWRISRRQGLRSGSTRTLRETVRSEARNSSPRGLP
jgi:hypothetical protein